MFRFDGVDMRTRRARRLKAILADLIAELGDDDRNTIRAIANSRAIQSQAALGACLPYSGPTGNARLKSI